MSRLRESSTEADGLGPLNPFDTDLPKKPNWVNLTQLETPIDDNIVNSLLYKPALRYHGITSGLWGLGLSRAPSLVSDSRPPSYKFSESIHSKLNADNCSTCDQGSLYKGLSAVSPVALRRRNTIAVILVAIGLLAAVATITGIILHLMHPKSLLRGHVRFTIANGNFTEDMLNKSSEEFKGISRTICSEMDLYYLTSELSDFYLGCRLISLSNDTEKPGLAVHYTIDFKENPTTNDKHRIKNVILRKSGRQASDANLFFVINDYLIYLKSLRVELDKIPMPGDSPGFNRPIIPWRDDIGFIQRKSIERREHSSYTKLKPLTSANDNKHIANTSIIVTNHTKYRNALKAVLPNAPDMSLPVINRNALYVRNNQTNFVATPFVLSSHVFTDDTLGKQSIESQARNTNFRVEHVHEHPTVLDPTPTSLFMTSKTFTGNIPGVRNVIGIEHVNKYPPILEPTPATFFITTQTLSTGNDKPQERVFKQGRLTSGNRLQLQKGLQNVFVPREGQINTATFDLSGIFHKTNSSLNRILSKNGLQQLPKREDVGTNEIPNGNNGATTVKPSQSVPGSEHFTSFEGVHNNLFQHNRNPWKDITSQETLDKPIEIANRQLSTRRVITQPRSDSKHMNPQPIKTDKHNIIPTKTFESLHETTNQRNKHHLMNARMEDVNSPVNRLQPRGIEVVNNVQQDPLRGNDHMHQHLHHHQQQQKQQLRQQQQQHFHPNNTKRLDKTGAKEFTSHETLNKRNRVENGKIPIGRLLIKGLSETTNKHTQHRHANTKKHGRLVQTQSFESLHENVDKSRKHNMNQINSQDSLQTRIDEMNSLMDQLQHPGTDGVLNQHHGPLKEGSDHGHHDNHGQHEHQHQRHDVAVAHDVTTTPATNTNGIQTLLEASFTMPEAKVLHMTKTPVSNQQLETKSNDVTPAQSKIMTLSKDMFIILGQSTKNYMEDSVLRPTKPLFSPSLQTVADSVEQLEHTSKLDRKLNVSPIGVFSNRPVLINDESSIGKSTHPVVSNSEPFGGRNGYNSNDTPVNGVKRNTKPPTNDVGHIMEMQEVIVSKPVRTNIGGRGSEVAWVNIFNEPRETVNVHVGEVLKSSNRSPNPNTKTFPENITTVTASDSVNFAIRDLLPDFIAMMNQWTNLSQGIDDANQIRPQPHSHSSIPVDNHLHGLQHHTPNIDNTPQHVTPDGETDTHNHGHITQNNVEEFNNDLNDQRFQHPNFRVHQMEHDNDGVVDQDESEHQHNENTLLSPTREQALKISWQDDTDVSTLNNGRMRPWRHPVNRELPPNQVEDHRRQLTLPPFQANLQMQSTPAHLQHNIRSRNPLFQREQLHGQRRLDVVTANIAGLPSQFPARDLRSQHMLRQRNGIQWHFPVSALSPGRTNTRDERHVHWNTPELEPPVGTNYIGQDEYANDDDTVDSYSHVLQRRIDAPHAHRELVRYPMATHFTNSRFASRTQGTLIWRNDMLEIPVSTDFNDIEDIRHILKDIIKSLFNMTEKIDNMQGAIDFINNTLHEENRPIFRLENTLNNMSTSLDNLKVNLNNIMKTMDGFKKFLKQFDNTVFNVDDVITHLDETIDNLGKTAVYVGSSLDELNDTVNFVDDVHLKSNTSLIHLNNSAYDVKRTTNFANKTLDSMSDTLESLENAVKGLNLKVGEILGDVDGINISLKNINDTVRNSYRRMKQISRKMNFMNFSVDSIEQTVERLNKTYNDINKALGEMNETFAFINGTALDVIGHLRHTDGKLMNISNNIGRMTRGMLSMNTSLQDTLDWMADMVKTLNDFNSNFRKQNNTFIVNLQNTDLIETLSTLIGMNNTLFEFGNKVDHINKKLDVMENTLSGLEANLDHLQETLANINITFRQLNSTIETTNTTIKYITKSLGHLNGSIDSLHKQSDDLTTIFGSIDKTLDAVNATILKINQTTHDVKESAVDVNTTLQTKAKRVHHIKRLTGKVVDSLNNSSGSLEELNNRLYNANESLRVIHGEKGIVSGSYDILTDTLNGIVETIDALFQKVDDTDVSLSRVNVSFVDVESSLRKMEQAGQSWNERLEKLTQAFAGMNESLKDIGSAFPNLMSNMRNLHKSIILLQNKIEDQSDEVTKRNNRKAISYDRYVTLESKTNELRQILLDTKGMLQDIGKFSSAVVSDGIDGMTENLIKADELYDNFKINLQLLNDTLVPLQNRYDKIRNEIGHKKVSLRSSEKYLYSSLEDLRNIENSTKRYNNIQVPFTEVMDNLTTSVKLIEDLQTDFTSTEGQMINDTSLLWNDLKEPIAANQPHTDLTERIISVNSSLNTADDLLMKTDEKLDDIRKQKSEVDKLFSNTRLTIKKIDVFEDISDRTNDKILQVNTLMSNKRNNSDAISKKLTSLQQVLSDMKLDYGSINGTHNNSFDDYSNLEDMLTRAQNDMYGTLNGLDSTRTAFSEVVKNIGRTNDEYNRDTFTVDKESHDRLQGYTSELQDSNNTINVITRSLENITDTIDKTDNLVKELDALFKSLENDLADKKDSHNFIKKKKPKVEARFKRIGIDITDAIGKVDYLGQNIVQLKGRIDVIKNRSDSIPNMQIDLLYESEMLERNENELNGLSKNISLVQTDLQDAKDWFNNLTMRNASFEEVRDSYISLRNTVRNLKETSGKLLNETHLIGDNLKAIDISLDGLNGMLNKFNASRLSATRINDKIAKLEQKSNSTKTELNGALARFNKLESNLIRIQLNYTNFTATNVDFSESFILETIEETKNLFSTLEDAFSSSKYLLNELLINRTSVGDTMDLTVFDRNNVNEILEHVLTQIYDMDTGADQVNTSLELINNKIEELNVTIQGVNDTLHATNKQLFIDRQKKMLADSKFPHLAKEHKQLNTSLGEMTIFLENVNENISNIMQNVTDLENRLDMYPNLNISTTALFDILRNIRSLVSSGMSTINETRQDMRQISDILWLEDGKRYTENETIAEMKNRYKDALEKMNNINDIIENLNKNITQSLAGATKVNSDITSLNTSLDEYDALSERWNNVPERVQQIADSVDRANSTSEKIGISLVNVNDNFSKLRKRFKDIDEHIVNTITDGLQQSILNAHENFTEINTDLDEIRSEMRKLKNMITDIQDIKSNTISNKTGLKYTNELVDVLLTNVTNLSPEIDFLLNRLFGKFNHLIGDVQLIDDGIDKAKQDLLNEEKRILYDSNSPNQLFEKSKNYLQNIKERQGAVETNLNTTTGIYFDVKRRLDDIPHIEIPVSDVRDSLLNVNHTLLTYQNKFEEINNRHKYVESLLTALDGNPYSVSETIDELKDRLNTANQELRDIMNTLNNVTESLDGIVNITLPDQIATLNTIDGLLDEFNRRVNELEELGRSKEKLDNALMEDVSLQRERKRKLDQSLAMVNNLKTQFGNVTNKEIEKAYSTLQTTLMVNEASFEDLVKASTNITLESKQVNRILNHYIDMSKRIFTSTGEMENYLKDLPEVNKNTEYEIDRLNNKTSMLQKEGADYDDNFARMENMIKDLNVLLENEEKMNFVSEMLNDIGIVLDSVDSDIQNSSRYTAMLQRDLEDTANVVNKVKGALIIIPTVNISTHFQTNEVENCMDSIHRSNKTIQTINNIIDDVRKVIDNTKTMDYISNNTLDEIKDRFSDMSMTLNMAQTNITSVLSDLAFVDKSNNSTKEYLGDILNESDRLNRITTDVHRINDVLQNSKPANNDLHDNHKRLNETIQQLRANLSEIGVLYQHVNRTDLWDSFNSIDETLRNNSHAFAEVSNQQNYVDALLTDFNDIVVNMKNKLNETVHDLDELKSVNDVISTNITTSNILDDRTSSASDLQLLTQKEIFKNLNKTRLQIQELEENLKHQQMKAYIKERLPEILDKHKIVNETLNEIKDNVSSTSTDIEELYFKLSNVNSVLSVHPVINVSLFKNKNDYDNIASMLQDILSKDENITDSLKSIYASISSTVEKNDTLETIKNRMDNYIEKLDNTLKQIEHLNKTVDSTENDTANQLKDLNLLDDEIRRFDRMTNDTALLALDVDEVGTDFDGIGKELKAQQQRIIDLSDNMQNLLETFSNVNDSELQLAADVLTKTLKQIGQQVEGGVSEFTFVKQGFDFDKKLVNGINRTLTIPVSKLDGLTELIDKTNVNISNIRQNLNRTVDDFIPKLSNDLNNQSQSLESIDSEIQILYDSFIEKNKKQYLENIIPKLLESYRSIHNDLYHTDMNLKSTTTKISQTNGSLFALEDVISNHFNINFNTSQLHYHLDDADHDSSDTIDMLKEQQQRFDDIDGRVFTEQYWMNRTIKEIKQRLGDIKAKITDIETNITDIERFNNQTADDAESVLSALSNMTKTIINYDKVKEISFQQGTKLDDFENTIKTTEQVLNNITSAFKSQMSLFTNLTSSYPNISSDSIDRLKSRVESILSDTVGLRLPLFDNLFQTRMRGRFNNARDIQSKNTQRLNETHTSNIDLDNLLNKTEQSIANISLDLAEMKDTNVNFNKEGNQLKSSLADSNTLLSELENSLKNAEKERFLSDEIPKMIFIHDRGTEHWQNTSLLMRGTERVVNESKSLMDTVKDHIKLHENVNISTLNIGIGIREYEDTIGEAGVNLKMLNADMLSLSPDKLNKSELLQNASMDIFDIKRMFNKFKQGIKRVQNETLVTKGQLMDVHQMNDDTYIDLRELNKLLTSLTAVKRDLNDSNEYLRSTNVHKASMFTSLDNSFETLLSQNASLYDLLKTYTYYNVSSSTAVQSLEDAKTELDGLLNQKADIQRLMGEASDEISSFDANITAPLHSSRLLNETNTYLIDAIPRTNQKIKEAEIMIKAIEEKIPAVAFKLESSLKEIAAINKTLRAEDNKQKFSENALPKIKQRYRNINVTFDVANKSLQLMQDNIAKMEAHIEKVKTNMNKFSSINISMSDIETNVTRMEDRLAIMREHYNNVEDIIKGLHIDLNENDILGENVSLGDLKLRYGNFSESLDNVESILQKVDTEITDMDDHLMFINETVISIDVALDQFENESNKTKNIKSDIEVVETSLNDANTDINDLAFTLDSLNSSFNTMQNIYKDVIDTLAENNTQFINTMAEFKTQFDAMKRNADDVNTEYMRSSDTFNKMNETLHQEVSTYSGLNDTLYEVKDTYALLKGSLEAIVSNLSKNRETRDSLNSSLANLGDVLSQINNTLHKEQMKYNFLNSNYGGLHTKTQAVGRILTEAEKFITNVKAMVENGNSTFVKLQSSLDKYPNLNISLQDTDAVINTAFETIEGVQTNHTDMKDIFDQLISNITSAKDMSGRIGDIKRKYDVLNETLDAMNIDIQAMNNNLELTKNDTTDADESSNQLIQSIEAFGNVLKVADQMDVSLKKVSEQLEQPKSILNKSNDSVSTLEQNAHEMLETYRAVDDKLLKENLTAVIKELEAQKNTLNSLNMKHSELSSKLSGGSNLTNEIQQALRSTMNSKFEIDTAVENSSYILNKVNESTSDISVRNIALVNESLKAQSRIRDLETKLQELNDTLYEEKMKIDFVKQNFPDAKMRYNILNDNIKTSDVEINNASDNFEKVNNALNYLNQTLDSISVIKIPLDIEKQVAEEIRNEIADLTKTHKTISGEYDKLNVTRLQDRQRTFTELKGEYDNFSGVADKLGNDVRGLGDRVKILNDRLRGLNMTMIEVDSTLDRFTETNTSASSLMEKVKKANTDFITTNKTLAGMSSSLEQLNRTLHDIMGNFSDVKDPKLIGAKDSIQKLLSGAMLKMSQLKDTTDTLNALNKETNKSVNALNGTLLKSKTSIGGLQTDIDVADDMIRNISSLLNRIYDQNIKTNSSSELITPDISSIVDKINELHASFETEQKKLDFIKDHKPVLEMAFRDLSTPLQETNKRISKTEVGLADLSFSIKSVGDRLNRFKPIDITTKPELKRWQEQSESVKQNSNSFVNISKAYNSLKKDLKSLDNRNKSFSEIQKFYNNLNKTIKSITDGLSGINTSLSGVDKESKLIDTDVKHFDKIMNDFRTVQNEIKSLMAQSEQASTDFSTVKTKSNRVDKGLTSLQSSVNKMQTKYKVLKDKVWEKQLPRIKTVISNLNKNIKSSEKKSNALNTAMKDTTSKITGGLTTLQKTGLTRTNAMNIIARVNKTAAKSSADLNASKRKIINLNETLSAINKKRAKTETELNKLSRSLDVELKKRLFVNQNLPDLRSKHTRVNGSFVANVPDVKYLQSQIDDIVSVISRIKEKMRVFGLQDTDKSVQKWDKSIKSLNNTVNGIIRQNKQTAKKLMELKKKLWKPPPMYTKAESLKVVKDRFRGYNKSLEDIIASVHKIEVVLKKLDNTSQELGMTLLDHDDILTTTPEPLGPPAWLQFTSTDVGIIGKDSGFVECSVGDLVDWEIMTITRKRGNSKEEVVAAWKLGFGARKIIRDRRISVTKSQNDTGGSLKITIRSLQCEDKATYSCLIDTYRRYPLKTQIAVITPPEDSLTPDFPTEVFEDKIANFSCTGHPGYPDGSLVWHLKHRNDKEFKEFNFYSAKPKVSDKDCIRTETNTVEYQFDMSWNNTKIRCYIGNTTFHAEGIIRLLPYDICNKVRFLGTIRHPYTPHKYIVCGKELNIMQCPGNTCYDSNAENCIQCSAGQQSSDPCHGKPMFTYVAHEKDCRRYYICMGPTKTLKKCTKGYFHPNAIGKCALSYAQSYCAQRAG